MREELRTAEWELGQVREKVITAALEVTRCERVGVETAGDSFALDMAHDELDDLLAGYVSAVGERDRIQKNEEFVTTLKDDIDRLYRDSLINGRSYFTYPIVDPAWFLSPLIP